MAAMLCAVALVWEWGQEPGVRTLLSFAAEVAWEVLATCVVLQKWAKTIRLCEFFSVAAWTYWWPQQPWQGSGMCPWIAELVARALVVFAIPCFYACPCCHVPSALVEWVGPPQDHLCFDVAREEHF
jgi:hypothetical protein